MINKECINCNKSFKVHLYRKDTAIFCSIKCKHEYLKENNTSEIKCDNCGKLSIKQNSKIHNLNFCSRECMHDSELLRERLSISIINSEKHKEGIKNFKRVYKKGVHNSLETEFKSGEQNPNWKGGTDKGRGRDWLKQRKKALERDNYLCQRCGKPAEHVHHRVRYSLTKDNNLDNLMSLCNRCHIIHERGHSKLIIEGEDIVITHVPKTTYDRFYEIASEEDFNCKMGMVLKYLIDFHDGVLGAGTEHLESAIIELNSRVDVLETDSVQGSTPEEEITTGSGRIIKKPKMEDEYNGKF